MVKISPSKQEWVLQLRKMHHGFWNWIKAFCSDRLWTIDESSCMCHSDTLVISIDICQLICKSCVLISSPLSSNGILEKVPQLLHICENVWAGLLQMMCPHWSSVSIHFYSGLEIYSPSILCSPKITFDYGSFLGSIIF